MQRHGDAHRCVHRWQFEHHAAVAHEYTARPWRRGYRICGLCAASGRRGSGSSQTWRWFLAWLRSAWNALALLWEPWLLAGRLVAPHATAVVLRDYTSALWTDTVADRADEVAAARLARLAEAHARRNLDARLVMANRGCARAGRTGSVSRTSPPSEMVTQAAHTGSCLAARLRVYTRNAPVGSEPSEAEAQEESTTRIVAD